MYVGLLTPEVAGASEVRNMRAELAAQRMEVREGFRVIAGKVAS